MPAGTISRHGADERITEHGVMSALQAAERLVIAIVRDRGSLEGLHGVQDERY